jgi:CRISPR-associated protein Csm2
MYDKQIPDPDISQTIVAEIIADRNATILVEQASSFGAALQTAGLTKSQIRGIFGRVRQIKGSWDSQDTQRSMRQVLLLKPRLAYQAAREPKVRPLAKVLTYGIDSVANGKTPDEQKERFSAFVDLFEAILAYHTAAGGR